MLMAQSQHLPPSQTGIVAVIVGLALIAVAGIIYLIRRS